MDLRPQVQRCSTQWTMTDNPGHTHYCTNVIAGHQSPCTCKCGASIGPLTVAGPLSSIRGADDGRDWQRNSDHWRTRAINAEHALEVAQAENARLETALGEEIDNRDRATDWADRLAYAVAPQAVIGEHSSGNNPWENALEHLDALHGAQAENARLRAALRPLAEYPAMESMRGREAWICRADAPDGNAVGITVEAVFNARAALSECASKDPQ